MQHFSHIRLLCPTAHLPLLLLLLLRQGLLWVWPDSSPARWLDSQMQGPPDDSRGKSEFIMSEVPIDFTMFLENAHDPCHANFLHEGLGFGTNKYSPDSAVPMKEFKANHPLLSLHPFHGHLPRNEPEHTRT